LHNIYIAHIPIISMLTYPEISPVAIELGPLIIRWYSLAYMVGIVFGWWLISHVSRHGTGLQNPRQIISKEQLSDLAAVGVIGIILGGRIGYSLFYNFDYYSQNPLEIFMIWHGGMSFHGGAIGIILTTLMYCRRKNINFLAITDVMACATPLGLMLGRITNFINGELYGRVTTSSLGMVFPTGDPLPRHPSQLYQAFGEGFLLLVIMLTLLFFTKSRERVGLLSGIFLSGYAVFRFAAEFFREPDPQLGFIYQWLTMGQLLCLPMLLLGTWLIATSRLRKL
jgi:phosphatidylglycerol:prolipoprotein diacylglycerol transferase